MYLLNHPYAHIHADSNGKKLKVFWNFLCGYLIIVTISPTLYGRELSYSPDYPEEKPMYDLEDTSL